MLSGVDIIKEYVAEFSRLQDWMVSIKESNPDTYNQCTGDIELKVTWTSLGVDLAELDRIIE